MDSGLDIGQLEPASQLPPLRVWKVWRYSPSMVLESTVVQAHIIDPTSGYLEFTTYRIVPGYDKPVAQVSQLFASWDSVEAITIQPEGTSVQ